MPSKDTNGKRISGTEYAPFRRIVHDFGCYVVAHLIASPQVSADPYSLRELVNDIMKRWIEDSFTCGDPNCVYCSVMKPNPTFRREYVKKLGTKGEQYGTRSRSHED